MKTKSQNTGLKKAGVAKKDEFYTQLVDIEKELKHYKKQFRDKVVYCNWGVTTFYVSSRSVGERRPWWNLNETGMIDML